MSKLPATLRRDMGMGPDVDRKKRKRTVPHDKSLQRLWRKVVLAEWGGGCAFQHTNSPSPCEGSVECHHVKRRNIPHLRHCPTNGIPLCQRHHTLAKLRVWRNRIEDMIGAEKMEWLDAQEQMLFPAFLAKHSQTREEYLRSQFVYLKALLKGDE